MKSKTKKPLREIKVKSGEMRLSWPAFLRLAGLLAAKIPNRYRTWVLIGKNGFRVGAALYNRVGKSIIKKADLACIQAGHYNGRFKQDKIILSPLVGEIKEPVLIIDDVVDSGDTMLAVKNKLKKKTADIAVIFKKPCSKVKPDYYVAKTDKWAVFPWE